MALSLEKYAEMLKSLDEEKTLEEAEEKANNPNTKRYSHEEMKQMARRIIDGK